MTARLSAEERRRQILDAAMTEFATNGFAATSTEAIAARVGISQPYLFRLFGTKKGLILATVEYDAALVCEQFSRAADDASGVADPAERLGCAYETMLREHPDVVRCQLQALAASAADPDVARVAREGNLRVIRLIRSLAGFDHHQTVEFFAFGMLLNVSMMLGVPDLFNDERLSEPHPSDTPHHPHETPES